MRTWPVRSGAKASSGYRPAEHMALGANDDPFGTPSAIDRLLAYSTGADRHHLRLDPASLGFDAIGHFAFFNERFRDVLWPLASDWLQDRKLPALSLIRPG